MNGKKRERVQGIDSVAVATRPQLPAVMVKDNSDNATVETRGQDQRPLVPLATKREDSMNIRRGMPLLVPLLDIEISLHLHLVGIENRLLRHLGSHVDSKNRAPARKDDTDMTLHPLPPPLLLLLESEDMKLPTKKTRDPTHLNKGPLPKMKRKMKLTHLLFNSDRRNPVVPPPPPPLTCLQGTSEERFLALALPQCVHPALPHPQLEVETRRSTIKGDQDPLPRAMSSRDKGQGPGLGPIPDPGGGEGGEGAEIVAVGETIAIVAVRVVLQDIDKGAAVEIDHQEENVGERGEGGPVDTGKQEGTALPPSLIEDAIEAEREEGVMETGGEGSVALLLKNELETERGKDLVEIEEEESAALLRSLMKNVAIDTVKEGGEGAHVYVDHHQTGTGMGGGGGEGGGADLAVSDDAMQQRYEVHVGTCICSAHNLCT